MAGATSSGGDGHDSGSYWDAVATEWDDDASPDDWRSHSDAVNLAACLRWWPTRPVGRVLKTDLFDEVAGEGLVAALAARASSVVGIDRSLEAARASRRRAGAGVVGADVRDLPFADGAFDLIVSNSTLDHFRDAREIARAIAELHRVLAPGGRVILTLDNPHNPVVWLRNALPFRALHHVGLVPYYVGATLSAADARTCSPGGADGDGDDGRDALPAGAGHRETARTRRLGSPHGAADRGSWRSSGWSIGRCGIAPDTSSRWSQTREPA